MRQCLELDTDRDSPAGKEIRTCFALFVTKLIDCFPRTILITSHKNMYFFIVQFYLQWNHVQVC